MIKFDNTMRVLNNYGVLFRETYRDNNVAAGYDPGEPLQNISFSINSAAGRFEMVFHMPDYWKWAENGRNPGKMPPKGSLTRWMEWKHILPSPMQLKSGKTVLPSMQSLEFLIRRSIGEHGTEGSHTWEQTCNELKDRLIKDVSDALKKDCVEYLSSLRNAA